MLTSITYRNLSERKAFSFDSRGILHINSPELGKSLLQKHGKSFAQAGLNASIVARIPFLTKLPFIYLEGEEHKASRKMVSHYFTPRSVEKYDFIEPFVRKLLDSTSEATDLTKITQVLAMKVIAELLGLGNKDGLPIRLERVINQKSPWGYLLSLITLYLCDIRPVLSKHRHGTSGSSRSIIAHLIDQNYSDLQIISETAMFGVAGILTTKEFAAVAAWHLMDDLELQKLFLEGDASIRDGILQQIAQVEPPIENMFRIATADIQTQDLLIKKGQMVLFHIMNMNSQVAQDERPFSFGTGHHVCIGEQLAIVETRIFLEQLFRYTITPISFPKISENPITGAYQLSQFMVKIS